MCSLRRFSQSWLIGLLIAAANLLSMAVLAQSEPANTASASSVESSSAPPEKPLYTSTVERDNALIAKAFADLAKADELVWLTTADEKFLSLYKPSEARKAKGVLVIMHAPETPQLWPTSLEILRRNLPVTGWATMALPLPAKYQPVAPEREASSSAAATDNTSASSPSSSTASTASANASSAATTTTSSASSVKPMLPRDQVISQRVNAAITQLNQEGQYNLVVMVDNSCAPDVLASLYKKINKSITTNGTIDGPMQALILINMQDQEPLTKEQLDTLFSVPEMPIMDVFFNTEQSQMDEQRRTHRGEAMRNNVKDYQQFIFINEPMVLLDDKQNFWVGKVHGFLERKAEGNELSNDGKGAISKNTSELK